MKIYNQWGLLIVESNDKDHGWDGYWKGVKQPIGNYVYIVKATNEDDNEFYEEGVITLLE